MGLFDSLVGNVLSKPGSNTDNPMFASSANMLANHEGELDVLFQQFRDKGLGDVIGSWVGTGQNAPISVDQLKSVLGEGKFAEIANSLGISHDDAANQLATALPQLIDKLTPNGQVNGEFISQAISMFSRR